MEGKISVNVTADIFILGKKRTVEEIENKGTWQNNGKDENIKRKRAMFMTFSGKEMKKKSNKKTEKT
jgi:hypothetical protein